MIPTRIDVGSLPLPKTVATTANSHFFPDKIIHPPLEIEHDFKLSSAPKERLAIIGHILFVPTKDGRIESIDLNAKKKIGRMKTDQGIQVNVIPLQRNLLLSLEFGKKSLHLFSPSENKYLWTVELGSIKTYPVIHGDKILVASLYRGIFCVNSGDGEIIWNTSLKSQLHSSPVIYDSSVIQGTESGVVASLSLETGEVMWRVELEDPNLASPIATDGILIFCTNAGRIAALSPDGVFIWQKRFQTAFRRTPVAAEGKLIIAGQDGIVRALSLDDGTLIWQLETDTVIGTNPVALSQHVLFGTLNRRLMFVSLETGQRIWEMELPGRVRTDPFLWQDRLIVGSENNHVYVFEESETAQQAFR